VPGVFPFKSHSQASEKGETPPQQSLSQQQQTARTENLQQQKLSIKNKSKSFNHHLSGYLLSRLPSFCAREQITNHCLKQKTGKVFCPRGTRLCLTETLARMFLLQRLSRFPQMKDWDFVGLTWFIHTGGGQTSIVRRCTSSCTRSSFATILRLKTLLQRQETLRLAGTFRIQCPCRLCVCSLLWLSWRTAPAPAPGRSSSRRIYAHSDSE